MESGDWVKFTELSGLDNFLERDFKIARTTGPFSFVIEADNVQGERSATTGWVTEVKKPVEISFNPLRKSIEEPGEFLLTDFGKFERPATYHACFRFVYFGGFKIFRGSLGNFRGSLGILRGSLGIFRGSLGIFRGSKVFGYIRGINVNFSKPTKLLYLTRAIVFFSIGGIANVPNGTL